MEGGRVVRAPENAFSVAYTLDQSLLSVGGFPSATAAGTELAGVARASGVPHVMEAGITAAVSKALAGRTLTTIVARVEAVAPKWFHMDLTLLENRFRFRRRA